MQYKGLKAVDLFAGAGGFSLAAIQAGYSLEFAVENDRHATETYRKNICNAISKQTELFELDVETLNPAELQETFFTNSRCDLLLGGPPCQGFSTHRIRDAGVGDPRNKLIHTYFSFVKKLKPRLFLMENVPGILWKRHEDYLAKFYEEGEKSGYKLFAPIVLDARDYGVPQRRRRVFILGVAEEINTSDFVWPPKPTHSHPNKIPKDSSLLPWVACQSVFSTPVNVDDLNNQHMNHGKELIEVFKKTPINGGSREDSGRVLPCHEKHDGHKDVYGRIDPFQSAPTMTTACINPSKGRFVHPTEHHGITLRQAARIQTFPDSYVFYGGLIAAGKQIGNAVPVELGKVIIHHISQLLGSSDETSVSHETAQECA
ncbi:DNA cytosine methyltransferase [Methylophaga sp. OBS4]|uniref:DNA cytosine methyltransferase n=1 Tax=Methylophaga sp. OBS4 TaxID=2991935 RepID=UPI002252E3FF|nr:DNA cytosine methyltransferase [Methylophaga sp. OBS4]MCX4187025.1 DNA cytosine methyltransferase [Methylophaga sp. OBS4]